MFIGIVANKKTYFANMSQQFDRYKAPASQLKNTRKKPPNELLVRKSWRSVGQDRIRRCKRCALRDCGNENQKDMHAIHTNTLTFAHIAATQIHSFIYARFRIAFLKAHKYLNFLANKSLVVHFVVIFLSFEIQQLARSYTLKPNTSTIANPLPDPSECDMQLPRLWQQANLFKFKGWLVGTGVKEGDSEQLTEHD